MAGAPKFKITTKYKITALAAIILQIQNGGGGRPYRVFVYIKPVINIQNNNNV